MFYFDGTQTDYNARGVGKGDGAVPADLTHVEARVLKYLERSLRQSCEPSYSEMVGAAGSASMGCGITRILASLEDKGYIARERGMPRSLALLREVGGQEFDMGTVRVPLVGCIAAGEPLLVPCSDSHPPADEMADLTIALLGGHENVYALKVKGGSMVDATVSDGDIVIMNRQSTAEDGDMAAVWLKNGGERP